jgi:hypothetical protein
MDREDPKDGQLGQVPLLGECQGHLYPSSVVINGNWSTVRRLARRATTRDKQDGEADGARPRHGSQRRLFLYVLMGAQVPPSHIACLTTMSHKTKCADNITSRLSNMDETLVNACRTPTILNRWSIDFLPRPKLTSRCNRIGECFCWW